MAFVGAPAFTAEFVRLSPRGIDVDMRYRSFNTTHMENKLSGNDTMTNASNDASQTPSSARPPQNLDDVKSGDTWGDNSINASDSTNQSERTRSDADDERRGGRGY